MRRCIVNKLSERRIVCVPFLLGLISVFFGYSIHAAELPLFSDVPKKFSQPASIEGEFLVQNFTVLDGLPQNHINQIAQTVDGYLWVATASGLVRYDGYSFRPLEGKDTEILIDRDFTSLLVDASGYSLWASYFDGVTKITGEEIKNWSLNDEFGGERIWDFWKRDDGHLLVRSGEKNLLEFDGKEFLRATLGFVPRRKEKVRSFFEHDGTLYLGGSQGLYRRTAGSRDWEEVLVSGDRIRGNVEQMLTLRDGRLWIATSAYLVQVNGKEAIPIIRFHHSEVAPTAAFLIQDSEGYVWVGVSKVGLLRIDPRGQMRFDRIDELASVSMHCGLEDLEGNLWIGTSKGLLMLKRREIGKITGSAVEPPWNTRCVCGDGGQGILIGTEKGLFLGLNGKIQCVDSLNLDDRKNIRSLLLDSSGLLWLGARDQLSVFRGNRFYQHGEKKGGFYYKSVIAVFEDSKGHVYYATDSELFRIPFGRIDLVPPSDSDEEIGKLIIPERERITLPENMGTAEVRCFLEDRDGRIWIGTSGQGIIILEKDSSWTVLGAEAGLNDLRITALYIDTDESIWIGTEAGLSVFMAGEIRTLTQRDGLYQNQINSIIKDDHGDFWFSCNRGIFRVERNALVVRLMDPNAPMVHSIVYDESDGMPATETNGGYGTSAWRDPDGKLYFPTISGVAVVDPEKVLVREEPPPVTIRSVSVGQKTVLQAYTYNTASPPRVIVEANQERLVEIFFAANTFVNPEHVKFQYRLDEHDGEWIEKREGRSATYPRLVPGDYTFRVVATNSRGIPNESGATLFITVKPRFYETTAFFIGIGVAALGMVGAGHRYFLRRRIVWEHLESEVKLARERSRIAQDMHDEMGANLTRIGYMSEVAKTGASESGKIRSQLENISKTSRELVATLGEIIWATNPQNDTLPSLIAFLRVHAAKLLDYPSIECRLEFPNQIPSISVRSELRRALYLVLKEASNNIIKHAEATRVVVELKLTDAELALSISDDGKGHRQSVNSNVEPGLVNGNGLKNMARRIQDVKGSFTMRSEDGKGTQIFLRVPI